MSNVAETQSDETAAAGPPALAGSTVGPRRDCGHPDAAEYHRERSYNGGTEVYLKCPDCGTLWGFTLSPTKGRP